MGQARTYRREWLSRDVGAGIVLTFSAVGLALAIFLGASGLNQFAANPWVNLGITALFLGFALSLFGTVNLTLPSSMVTKAVSAERGHGQFVGTLLMGFAFTLTSFTCTAPFIGSLLVVAATGNWQWPLAGMLAFSSVFALPFVILALVPQRLASLPRAGTWLTEVKAIMGLLEVAAAMKFLSNVDLVWHWGIFTRTVVLVSWVVIALAMAWRFAAAARRSAGFARPALAIASLLLAVWLVAIAPLLVLWISELGVAADPEALREALTRLRGVREVAVLPDEGVARLTFYRGMLDEQAVLRMLAGERPLSPENS